MRTPTLALIFVKAGIDSELAASGSKFLEFDFDQITGIENRVDRAGAAAKRINL